MGTKVKPVQPTVIKDKKIVREVIEQIRKPISAKVIRLNEKRVYVFLSLQEGISRYPINLKSSFLSDVFHISSNG
jgi:hypothetical protein